MKKITILLNAMIVNIFCNTPCKKPYGCKAYGFISKYIPSLVVFQTSGIKCAYKKLKNYI